MLVLRCAILLSIFQIIRGIIQEIPTQITSERCVTHIIKTYFPKGNEITFVDINGDNNNVLKLIHSLEYKSLISRTTQKLDAPNDHYFVVTNTPVDFVRFRDLVKESFWNPDTRFIILSNNLNKENLKNIFDVLLETYVRNALVLNDTFDPDLYAYNPYENFRCGKSYDKIIELGKCSKSETLDLFPPKLVTRLRNCTFKVMLPHWPPYTINPSLNSSKTPLGVEERIFRHVSELEHFNINVSYNDYGENFTKFTPNMSAVGPLMFLQNGEADVVFGGLVLTEDRADVFDYIYGHLTFQESLSYLVKRAKQVPTWKNLYLGFNIFVWVALLFTFLVYFFIFIILFHPRDKGQLILKMLSYLFLNGTRMKGSRFKRFIFITWVWFAYLIHSSYESSFTSVTTHPIMEHQIETADEIVKYELEPCISRNVLDYMVTAMGTEYEHRQRPGCHKLLESIKIVSESDYTHYTVILDSIYDYYKFEFYSEYGNPKMYRLKKHLLKSIYTIYLYKGFPMTRQLQTHLIRLRENGLIELYISHILWDTYRHHHFKAKTREWDIFIPWYILVFGYCVSALVLLAEILIVKNHRKRNLEQR